MLSGFRDHTMTQQQLASLSLRWLESMPSNKASWGSRLQMVDGWRACRGIPSMQILTLNGILTGSAPASRVQGRKCSLAYPTVRSLGADSTLSRTPTEGSSTMNPLVG
jgi:hypothetical protein